MDTLTEYRKKIRTVLQRRERRPSATADFTIELAGDETQDRYLLVHLGWDGYRRLYGVLIHIDIIDDKIWIQKDDTEEGIAEDLVRAGVPQDRIVLAFKHPSLRPYTEFAAA